MITILSEVSSRKLYGTGTVYYLKPDHLINIQHFAVQNYFKFYFLVLLYSLLHVLFIYLLFFISYVYIFILLTLLDM